MNKIENLAIMASAGTGKTYTLAMRYITLLLLEVEPEEIVAMTFTNKAAGEIFDKIIQILLNLIERPEELESAVNNGLLPSGTTRGAITDILRKILSHPDKLRIFTYDSFFFNIISAFPLECGIAGGITLLNENDDTMRTKFLLHLIRDAEPNRRAALLELLKMLSFNMERYSLLEEAKSIIEKYYTEYLKYPDRDLWMHDSFLNPEISRDDILEADKLMNISEFLEKDALRYTSARFVQLIRKIAELARSAIQFTEMPVNISNSIAEKLCAMLGGNMSCSEISISYYKLFTLNGMLLKACKEIISHLAAVEDRSLSNRNSALYILLNQFDLIYSRLARCSGYLTFKDIPYLLKNDRSLFADRLVLEERLDSQYNHYLLDEFQDTSDEQWNILKNLIDEVFQPEQERFRSFFYVGDIKQSIYQWRDGNPKLFSSIYRQYSDPGYNDTRLLLKDLSKSYRSSIPVIDTVNCVFGKPDLIKNEAVGNAVRQMDFHLHSSSESAAAQPGCAMLIEYLDPAKLSQTVFDLICSLDPFSEKNNCTVGILTLSNKFASEMAENFCDLLNSSEEKIKFEVSLEGVTVLEGSPAYSIFRSMLILAEHPDDPMARGYLSMISSSENKMIMDFSLLYSNKEKKISSAEWFEEIGCFIRKSVSSDGFTSFLRRFLKVFQSYFSSSDSMRMELVLDSAMKFDSTGSKNISEFIEFLDRLEVRSSSVRKTVQFMTIHKSKGLDFDIVILPELFQTTSMDKPEFRDKLFIRKDEAFQPLWVSFPPKSQLFSAFPEMENVLNDMKDSRIYETCCQLYVAMTRARNALYMLIPQAKTETSAYRLSDFLKNTLIDPAFQPIDSQFGKVLYSAGEPQWMQMKSSKEKSLSPLIRKARQAFYQLAEQGLRDDAEIVLPKRIETRKPSDHKNHFMIKTAKTDYDGAEFGTHLHELMSRIGYLDECDTETLLSEYLASSGVPEEMTEDFSSVFRSAVASPDAAALLSNPGEHTELWREKKFSIRMNEKLINCVFDRVDVIRDPDGKIQKVRIVDYKSDNSDDPEYFRTNYGEQLAVYAEVLQRLFGIVPEKYIFILRSGKTLHLD